MRIKKKQKLNLIDNYIAIYRILYNCKIILTNKNSTFLEDETSKIQKLCDQTLDLKNKYENAFFKLKMVDDSFLLLKQQLNESKGYSGKIIEICNLTEICDSINIIESDYLKLKL